jgi:hypothetical protein
LLERRAPPRDISPRPIVAEGEQMSAQLAL